MAHGSVYEFPTEARVSEERRVGVWWVFGAPALESYQSPRHSEPLQDVPEL